MIVEKKAEMLARDDLEQSDPQGLSASMIIAAFFFLKKKERGLTMRKGSDPNTCDALEPAIASAIEDADTVAVYAISCFEVALLVKGRKLEPPLYTVEWIKESLDESSIVCLPITCGIVQRSVKLTDVYRDPADRIIIATALEHGAQLASYDTAFPNYPELSGYLLTGQQA